MPPDHQDIADQERFNHMLAAARDAVAIVD
jgi:hypothetical protein